MLAVARQDCLPAEVRHPDTGFVDPKKASFSSEVGNNDNTCIIYILGKKRKTNGGCIYEKTECAKTYSWDRLPGLCVKRLDALACVRVELWHFV